MLRLIIQNLKKRKIQTASVFMAVMISAAVVLALSLVYTGVSQGISTSEARMGADIVVVPAGTENLIEEKALLFSGAPVSIYMVEGVEDIIGDVQGTEAVTSQFYGQTLAASCCSTGDERRLIGYDPETDWLIKPWTDKEFDGMLEPDEIIIGSKVTGFEDGAGKVLGRDMTVASVMDPSGTSLDYSIIVAMDTAREFAAGIKGYENCWERYGNPDTLISAVLVKTGENNKVSVANEIEMRGNFECITSSSVLRDIQKQMKVIFSIMLGAAVLLVLASVFQLFARFYSMAWDRKAELGLYRAMGASEGYIRKLIMGEVFIIITSGSVAGIAVGAALYKLIIKVMSQETVFPFIEPSVHSIFAIILMLSVSACVLGYIAVWVPVRQIKKIDPSIAMQKGDID